MGEHDEGRVEPRTVLVGRGMATTPERVAEIVQRRGSLERLSRAPPTETFEKVLVRRRGGPDRRRGRGGSPR